MTNFKTFAISAMACVFLFSCQDSEDVENEISQDVENEIINKFIKLGVNPAGITPYTKKLPDGTSEKGWLAHDIFLSEEDINNMSDLPLKSDDVTIKLFRSFELVNVPNSGQRTITIRGVNLDNRLQIGLQRAVDNYNQLGLGFIMALSFGNTTANSEIVVFASNNPGNGAVAGFPRNGNPHNSIEIFRDVSSNNTLGSIEHLMTHELGHCFGLRHSDLRTRSSCPPNLQGDEQASADGIALGAVFIPGTDPDGNSQTSVMRACFGNETGNFFNQDIVGLRAIY